MQIQESFEVDIAREAIYAEFNDVAGIGTCIAGVQDVEVVNADESRWRVGVSAGFMAITVELEARIVDRRPPELIAFAATGQNVDLSGKVELHATTNGTTRCDIVIDIDPQGPLAPMMMQLGRGPQERLAKQTIANLRDRLLAGVPDVAGAAHAPPAPARVPARSRRVELPATSAIALLAGGTLLALGYLLGRQRRR